MGNSEEQGNQGTILIVDDTPININILFDTFELEGYKVLVASNGESALERAAFAKPDLILLDVMMPGIDGFETCRLLKESADLKEIPVIFMTALSDTIDKVRGFELGAVDYITKPFQTEEVLARVTTHLMLRRLRDKLHEYNLTLEKKVEERTHELKIAKERAEQSDRLKTEFLSQISHEIRTPINGLLGFSQMIEAQLGVEPTEELERTLETLEKSGMRLVRTFDLILYTSQLHSQTYEFDRDEINLVEDVLEPIRKKYRSRIGTKQLNFEITKKCESDRLYIDKRMIELLFENVIDNAITYTPAGNVTVTVDTTADGEMTLSVDDTGIGISGEYLPKIFEPFSQEQQGFSRAYEGNGLGMALVKKICDAYHADIQIDSEKDRGTTCTITFQKHLRQKVEAANDE